MNIVQVKSGKVELRKDSGTLIRTIVSSGAVFADLNANQTLVLVTLLNGKVELRKENSSLVRTIVSSSAGSLLGQGYPRDAELGQRRASQGKRLTYPQALSVEGVEHLT